MDLKEIAKNLVYCKLSQKSFATCEHLSYFGEVPICEGTSEEESCPYRKKIESDKPERPYPDYATIEGSCVLRHTGEGIYYKDAGDWEVHTIVLDNKIIINENLEPRLFHMNGKELIPSTKKDWLKNNRGYTRKNWWKRYS